MTKVVMCAYCGRWLPWWPPSERRRWFPDSIFAECWPCYYRWTAYRPPEPRWWRLLAGLVRVDWRG